MLTNILIVVKLKYYGMVDLRRRVTDIPSMGDLEFIEMAKERYLTRNAIPVGGPVGVTCFAMRFWYRGLVPVPGMPLPLAIFLPMQLYSIFNGYHEYVPFKTLLSHPEDGKPTKRRPHWAQPLCQDWERLSSLEKHPKWKSVARHLTE